MKHAFCHLSCPSIARHASSATASVGMSTPPRYAAPFKPTTSISTTVFTTSFASALIGGLPSSIAPPLPPPWHSLLSPTTLLQGFYFLSLLSCTRVVSCSNVKPFSLCATAEVHWCRSASTPPSPHRTRAISYRPIQRPSDESNDDMCSGTT